jgi:hypothetical protein
MNKKDGESSLRIHPEIKRLMEVFAAQQVVAGKPKANFRKIGGDAILEWLARRDMTNLSRICELAATNPDARAYIESALSSALITIEEMVSGESLPSPRVAEPKEARKRKTG